MTVYEMSTHMNVYDVDAAYDVKCVDCTYADEVHGASVVQGVRSV